MEIFTYEQALNNSIKYFNGDELAARVFVDKYSLRNDKDEILEDTPKLMHKRIAFHLARIEKDKFKKPLSEEQIFSYLDKFSKIIPQGSMMFGIGNYYHYATLSNCYVINPPTDSYGGICRTDEQLVQISKRRGGNGTDISNIRPVGLPVKNSSRTTTGIIPFMKRFSNSIREVGQGGRRGALMLTISVHHPQVLDFASVKTNKDEVTGANISIRLTDEFLEAVDKDTEYEQRWPVDSKNPNVSIKVKARHVWKEIIKNAHNMAEPGLLFWDTIIKESPADCYKDYGFETISTNPCQPSWAKMLTKNGIRQLKDIQIGDEIWSKEGWTKVINKWSTGIKQVFEYRTTAGCFYGTENHKLLSNGTKIEAKDCESIDILCGPYFNENIKLNPNDIMDGLVIGDGSKHKASNDLVYLCIGKDDLDYLESEVKNLIIKYRPGLSDYSYEIETSISSEELLKTYDRYIPDRFFYGDRTKICGFLRGLYSANGSICGNRVTLKSSSFKLIEQVQTMLSSIGIKSYYTTNKPTCVKFSNGEYICKESYDLNISTDRLLFFKSIGFIQDYKTQKLINLIKNDQQKTGKLNYDIIDVSSISNEEVFDITVDNQSHTYWTQGCDVSNCSELPLPILDSCRLIVINLLSYVRNKFEDNAYFDYKSFSSDCQIMQRLIDDAIDLELEHIDRIINKIKKDPEEDDVKNRELKLWKDIRKTCSDGRRTGSGITALGDTLAALNIKYCSEKSLEVVDKIYKTLKLSCYRASVDMAKELGHFPVWNHDLEKENPFLLRIKDEDIELWNDMKKYGRRNIAILTTAPTGTVSLLTQTSSGIEPIFQPYYIRRKKITHEDKNARIDFTDNVGDKWQEFPVLHPQLLNWLQIKINEENKSTEIHHILNNRNKIEEYIKKSSWYGCCAEDLNWPDRVKLQSIAQKHIDHAISSTLNLPEDVSINKVAEIYETAWKSGCKGITIYRKNCRTGVLVDSKPDEKAKNIQILRTVSPKRPKKLDGNLHFFNFKGNKYYVAVGLLDNEPYEIFTGFNNDKKNQFIPKDANYGFIIKNKRGDYTFKDAKTSEEYKLTNGHADDNADALTRIISCSLRHGSDISFIVHQLEKTTGDLTSFSKCLARTLKFYIKDGTKITGENCSNCNSSNIQRDSGCSVCKDCGNSKCS